MQYFQVVFNTICFKQSIPVFIISCFVSVYMISLFACSFISFSFVIIYRVAVNNAQNMSTSTCPHHLNLLFHAAIQYTLLVTKHLNKFAEIDRCNPNPCQHGAPCEEINGGVGYVCQCPVGYKGQICDRT